MDPVAAAAAAAAAAAQSDSDDPDFNPAQVVESDADSAAGDARVEQDPVPEPARTNANAAAGADGVNGAASTGAATGKERATLNGNAEANGAPSQVKGGEKSSEKSSNDAKTNGTPSNDVDKALATARAAAAAVTARKESTSSEALWRQFNKPAPRRKRATNSGLDAWLGATSAKRSNVSDQPKAKTALPRLDEAAEASARAAAAVEERRKQQLEDEKPRKRPKVGTGLEAVLQAAKAGNVAPSTLDKTKSDWQRFKRSDQEVTDELEAYKKDKTRYTERVDFLQRSAVREWEVEQAGKKGRR